MVADPGDYRWSSYPAHGLGRPDPLLSPIPGWDEWGLTPARWRRKVRSPQPEAELAALRASVRTGKPFGTPDWVAATAERLGLNLSTRPRGRPRKPVQ